MFVAGLTTKELCPFARAAFVAKFPTPCSKPKARAHMREAHSP